MREGLMPAVIHDTASGYPANKRDYVRNGHAARFPLVSYTHAETDYILSLYVTKQLGCRQAYMLSADKLLSFIS